MQEVNTILSAIRVEVHAQRNKWGVQDHADGYWLGIAVEELGEAARASIEGRKPEEVMGELIQTAAVLVSWIECLNRRPE